MSTNHNQTMYAERLLPHDIEAEESLLGSLLINPEALEVVYDTLQADDFYRERNRMIYDAAIALRQKDTRVDQVTLADELNRKNLLESAGGMAYLSHLIAVTPTSIHAADYGEIISRTALKRRLITAASNIANMAYEDSNSNDETMKQAEEALHQVWQGAPSTGFLSLKEIFDAYLERRSDPFLDENSQLPVMSGYNALDEILGGLQMSDMTILGARPGVGKSALALNICMQAAEAGHTSGIVSLEMNQEQLATRILAAHANVNSHRLRLSLLTSGEEERIIQSIGVLSDWPLYIDDTPFQTIASIEGRVRRLDREQNLSFLVVDYLQLIQGKRRQENRVQEVSEISRGLKGLARDLNLSLLTCSQFNRTIENRPNHRPQLSDLRDSGSIEQDADIVIFIHREDLYTSEEDWAILHPYDPYPQDIAEIIVAKNRHGLTGNILLYFNKNIVQFENLPQQQP